MCLLYSSSKIKEKEEHQMRNIYLLVTILCQRVINFTTW